MPAELRYALRGFARHPGFTLAAVLTLALGLGAAAAIFSLADAVILRPLPFPNQDRLAMVWDQLTVMHLDRFPVTSRSFELCDRNRHAARGGGAGDGNRGRVCVRTGAGKRAISRFAVRCGGIHGFGGTAGSGGAGGMRDSSAQGGAGGSGGCAAERVIVAVSYQRCKLSAISFQLSIADR